MKRMVALVAAVALSSFAALAQQPIPGMALIPAGKFEMGDHHGFVDPKHGGDETPIHTVRLDAFYMGIYPVTTREYCEFLNSALAQRQIEVRNGGVYLVGGNDLLCETREMSPYSRIGWGGGKFTVLERKENHPIVCIRWHGAAAYCNWLSAQKRLPLCYDLQTWECDFNKSGFRLPTEAEWEYAARGGQQNPYYNYPWGDDADPSKANVPESKNPFRAGPRPWTTPVGFFNGKLHRRADFGWPGAQETFQTGNNVNGFGLYDMAGNVWEFINDWYHRDYYAFSPSENPPGPASGSIMPDGKPYRGMRGGSWFNGPFGHSRVSNRNPFYYRGPDPLTGRSDPDGPWFHIGFRIVLPVNAEKRPLIQPTPVQRVSGRERAKGGGPAGKGKGKAGGSESRGSDDRPQRSGRTAQARAQTTTDLRKPISTFVLRSPAVTNGGALPVEFTGDGEGATLPLEWSGTPPGTQSFAVIMHHEAPDMSKWYWILYNIPANVHGLPKNVKGVGTLGNNSVNQRTEYAPPHSKGPGPKTYIYTVYALSAPVQLTVPPSQVNREVLLAAMKDRLLGTAELQVVYSRPGDGTRSGEASDRPRKQNPKE